jgi:hypothetical protein
VLVTVPVVVQAKVAVVELVEGGGVLVRLTVGAPGGGEGPFAGVYIASSKTEPLGALATAKTGWALPPAKEVEM